MLSPAAGGSLVHKQKRGRQERAVVSNFAEPGTLAATGCPDPLVHFLGRSGYFQWGKLKLQICS